MSPMLDKIERKDDLKVRCSLMRTKTKGKHITNPDPDAQVASWEDGQIIVWDLKLKARLRISNSQI